MNRLKSLFISFYLTTALLFLIINIQKYIEYPDTHIWIAGILVQAFPLLFIGKLFLIRTPRTPASFPIITMGLFGLLTLIFFNTHYDAILLKQPIIYAIYTAAGWFVYVYWYSFLPERNSPILQVGKKLPSMEFLDLEGKPVRLNDFYGRKTVYLFYRGNWCPLCTAQIKELADDYQELEKRDVRVVLISPQPEKYTQKLSRKFNIPFVFLVDKNNAMAKKYRLEHQAGTPMGLEVFGYASNTVLPTVILADASDKIVFIDQTDNYRVRPEPKDFLRIFDSIL